MKLAVKKLDGRLYFQFSGELDDRSATGTREIMDKVISKEQFSSVVLDMRHLTFMDSTGIGLIIGRYKKLKPLGKEIFITNTNRQIDKILNTTGIYQIIKKIG